MPLGPSARLVGIDVQYQKYQPIPGFNVRFSDGTSTYLGSGDRAWLGYTSTSSLTLQDGEYFSNATGTTSTGMLTSLVLTTTQGRTLKGGWLNLASPWSVSPPSPGCTLYSLAGDSYVDAQKTWLAGVVMGFICPSANTSNRGVVSCSPPSTGWPRQGFNLTLAATSKESGGACRVQVTTAVTAANTMITVQAPDTTSVCSNAPVFALMYTVGSSNSSTTLVVSAVATNNVTCSVQPNVTGVCCPAYAHDAGRLTTGAGCVSCGWCHCTPCGEGYAICTGLEHHACVTLLSTHPLQASPMRKPSPCHMYIPPPVVKQAH